MVGGDHQTDYHNNCLSCNYGAAEMILVAHPRERQSTEYCRDDWRCREQIGHSCTVSHALSKVSAFLVDRPETAHTWTITGVKYAKAYAGMVVAINIDALQAGKMEQASGKGCKPTMSRVSSP
jgi:hypothetical protein